MARSRQNRRTFSECLTRSQGTQVRRSVSFARFVELGGSHLRVGYPNDRLGAVLALREVRGKLLPEGQRFLRLAALIVHPGLGEEDGGRGFG